MPRSFLGDPQSSHYEGMPDAPVQAALMARLREQHPNRTIPEPSAFFISRHGYDKNTCAQPLCHIAYPRKPWRGAGASVA